MAANTLHHHLNHPGEDVDTHVRRKRVALAQTVKRRTKVYLDTKYWALLRDARLDRTSCKATNELLGRLEALVAEGKVICPLNADVFFEVFKQDDPSTLTASVRLLDDLSLGVSLIPIFQRLELEVFHFLDSSRFGADAVHAIDELVWTKAAYILGFVTPDCYTLPKDTNDAVQRAFSDHMWDMGLTDMLNVMGADVAAAKQSSFPDISDQLNQGKFSHIDHHASFKSLFLAEVQGVVDAYKGEFADLMQYIFKRDTGGQLSKEQQANDNSGQLLANVIYNAFRLNRVTDQFPTIRVGAGLHAALRWDRKRKYKPNDTFDFMHATAALPYCDLFFTEHSLSHLVHDGNLQFDKFFKCKTYSAPEDALDALA